MSKSERFQGDDTPPPGESSQTAALPSVAPEPKRRRCGPVNCVLGPNDVSAPLNSNNRGLVRCLILALAACVTFIDCAVAQDPRSPKNIGVIWSGTEEGTAPYWGALVQGLRELGWIDGKTAHLTMRFDDDDKSRLPKLAAELVSLRVDVLAVTSIAAPAARSATTTIPIVACDAYDAVEEGLTSDLKRPSGNVTGVTYQTGDTAAKRVELARELMPRLHRVAVLFDPGDAGAVIDATGVRLAAARLGLELREFEVRQLRDFPAAFAAIKRYRPEALMVPTSTLMAQPLDQIVRFASSIRVPTFSELPPFADAGMFLTYGADYVSGGKLAAIQVDKLLKGANPATLPWEQPTKFELVVNMKTAKVLGLAVPESIMLRATRIIR
jgi:putative tryptophan/tyrosine transport system substrate-binding protein